MQPIPGHVVLKCYACENGEETLVTYSDAMKLPRCPQCDGHLCVYKAEAADRDLLDKLVKHTHNNTTYAFGGFEAPGESEKKVIH